MTLPALALVLFAAVVREPWPASDRDLAELPAEPGVDDEAGDDRVEAADEGEVGADGDGDVDALADLEPEDDEDVE